MGLLPVLLEDVGLNTEEGNCSSENAFWMQNAC